MSTNTEAPISQDSAQAMFDAMACIAVAVGRSKDGTGRDVDWFELEKDVEKLAREHAEMIDALRTLAQRMPYDTYGPYADARALLRKVAP